MENLEFKIAAALAVLLIGLLGGFVALRPFDERRRDILFSLGSAFAGGVFLGAGLIHLLGDSVEHFAAVAPDLEYPLAYLLAAAAFAAILFLERVLGTHAASIAALSESATIYPYLLAIVLSVHSVLAGMALGAEDTIAGWLVIFIAIMAHKGAAGFAL